MSFEQDGGEETPLRGACPTPGFLELLLDTVDQAVMATDKQGTILYWNRGAEALYGWNGHEVMGKNILDVTPCTAMKEQAGRIMQALSRGERWSGDFEMRRKDGSVFTAHVTDTPIMDDNDNLVGIVGLSHDRTHEREREEQERDQHRAHAVHSQILSQVGDAVVTFEKNNRIIYWNPAAESLYGWSAEEAVGQDAVKLLAAPGQQRNAHEAISLARKNKRWEGDFLYQRKDGSLFTGFSTDTVLRGGDGDGAYIMVVRDRTKELEELQKETALAHERAFHSKILERIADSVIVTDAENRILYWNKASEELLDWKADEVIGLKMDSFMKYEVEDGEQLAHIVHGLSQGNTVEANYRSRRKDGFWIQVHAITAPLLDVAQNMIGTVSITRDRAPEIRRTQLEAENVRQQARLDLLNGRDSERTRFVHMVAHELNNPLTPIITQLELIRMKLAKAPRADIEASVAVIERSTTRTRLLVKDLLDTARIQGKRLDLAMVNVDLGELLRQTADELRAVADEAGISISTDAEPGTLVEADPHRFSQVTTNLVKNALKHTPQGGTIRLRLRQDGDHVEIRVEDTGSGIPKGDQARIFEAFEQIDVQPTKGSGLGLYICKGIVEAHGGAISCQSDGPGTGSTFIIRLPFARATNGIDLQDQDGVAMH